MYYSSAYFRHKLRFYSEFLLIVPLAARRLATMAVNVARMGTGLRLLASGTSFPCNSQYKICLKGPLTTHFSGWKCIPGATSTLGRTMAAMRWRTTTSAVSCRISMHVLLSLNIIMGNGAILDMNALSICLACKTRSKTVWSCR